MPVFYAPDIKGDTYILNEEESKHASRVLRLSLGDEVILTDGKGNWMPSVIMDAHAKRCLIQVKEVIPNYQALPYELHMAVAPTKNISRYEWYLEKATEIGIHKITALRTEHSERKDIKLARLEKVITAAMKQSLKAYHPSLEAMIAFKDFMKAPFEGKKFIAWCEAKPGERLEKYLSKGEKALILIGPEGGFSPSEIQQAMEEGFHAISISQSRLRTETAALVACHSVAFINQS